MRRVAAHCRTHYVHSEFPSVHALLVSRNIRHQHFLWVFCAHFLNIFADGFAIAALYIRAVKSYNVRTRLHKRVNLFHSRRYVTLKSVIVNLDKPYHGKSCLLLDRYHVTDAACAYHWRACLFCRPRHKIHYRLFLHIQRLSRNSLARHD